MFLNDALPESANFQQMINTPELVTGFRAGFVRRRIHIFIFLEALRFFRNPFRARKALLYLRELRGKAHGADYVKKYVKAGARWFWNSDYAGFPSLQLREMVRLEFLRNREAVPVLQLASSGHRAPRGASPGNQPSPVASSGSRETRVVPAGNSLHLQTLIWGITNRCPLSCAHCYEWDNLDKKEKLSLEELQKILDVFRVSGLRHLQFSGGEPLVRFHDLVTLVREASPEMDCWLLTSGFGLTRDKAAALASAGLTGVQISLDHWDGEKHNAFRNHPDSFRWVGDATRHCQEAGLPVSLSLCATRDFVTGENLEKYAETARTMGARFIRILEPRAVGRFAHADVSLRNDQITLLSDFARRMNNDPRCRTYPVVAFFGYHQRLMGCFGAGNRYLYVDPRGDVHACPFCRGARGNILQEPLRDIAARVRAAGCHRFRGVPAS